jgi:tetraacyldisaccharide 4'-kinase
VVVGNITVGGTGKTPLLLTLSAFLRQRGFNVGIVARGYGGASQQYPLQVEDSTPVETCGDEAKMLAMASGCPVFVDPIRTRAIDSLNSHYDVDVILSDDGLQHYGMSRDIEIVVVDSERGFGNCHCLPVGPLREPLDRLKTVDFVLLNGDHYVQQVSEYLNYSFDISPTYWKSVKSLSDGKIENVLSHLYELDDLNRDETYTAVAGIGNPERFFNTLTALDIRFQPQVFPDHHQYTANDFKNLNSPILMTEKDAVKCSAFAQSDWYYLNIKATIDPRFIDHIVSKIRAVQAERISK